MSVVPVVLIVGVLALILVAVLVRSQASGTSHPARKIAVGTSRDQVRRLIGDPPGGFSTGRDVIFGGGAVVGGTYPSDSVLNEQYWLYRNVPPGHDTQIVMSGRGVVTSVEITPARTD